MSNSTSRQQSIKETAWDLGETIAEWPLDAIASRRLVLSKRTYEGVSFFELRREERDRFNEGSFRTKDRTTIRINLAKELGEALIKAAT